jgi:hypothetical protein
MFPESMDSTSAVVSQDWAAAARDRSTEVAVATKGKIGERGRIVGPYGQMGRGAASLRRVVLRGRD